jgi:hypothetical protein
MSDKLPHSWSEPNLALRNVSKTAPGSTQEKPSIAIRSPSAETRVEKLLDALQIDENSDHDEQESGDLSDLTSGTVCLLVGKGLDGSYDDSQFDVNVPHSHFSRPKQSILL